MDPLEKAEEVLDRAADVYEKTMNGDGLHNIATTWLQLWDSQRPDKKNEKQSIGFGFDRPEGTDEDEEVEAIGEEA